MESHIQILIELRGHLTLERLSQIAADEHPAIPHKERQVAYVIDDECDIFHTLMLNLK